MSVKYYNFNRLVHLKDSEGDTPSVFLVTNNRTAGKTTGALHLALKDYFEKNRQFMLLYRNMFEIESTHLLFGDVLEIYFPEYEMESEPVAKGLFYQLILKKEKEKRIIGFAVCIKKSDNLKKYSPVFSKVFNLIFDEYQLEDGKYIKNEVEKLESILITVSRGGGNLVRDTRLFLLGNPFSPINPYYSKYDIWKKLQPDTKVLRGKGWVADFTINEEAKKAITENKMSAAFNSKYTEYARNGTYLNDPSDFIKKPKGHLNLLFYVKSGNDMVSISAMKESIYVKTENKETQKAYYYTFQKEYISHGVNYAAKNTPLYKNLLKHFQQGNMFFNGMKSKEFFFEHILNI